MVAEAPLGGQSANPRAAQHVHVRLQAVIILSANFIMSSWMCPRAVARCERHRAFISFNRIVIDLIVDLEGAKWNGAKNQPPVRSVRLQLLDFHALRKVANTGSKIDYQARILHT